MFNEIKKLMHKMNELETKVTVTESKEEISEIEKECDLTLNDTYERIDLLTARINKNLKKEVYSRSMVYDLIESNNKQFESLVNKLFTYEYVENILNSKVDKDQKLMELDTYLTYLENTKEEETILNIVKTQMIKLGANPKLNYNCKL